MAESEELLTAGVWDGEVPPPVALAENIEHEAAPPDAPGDAGEA